MFEEVIVFIRELYHDKETIPLHEPVFWGNEKEYLCDCIDTAYVSSVGEYVDQFENRVADFVGAKYAVATVNGTSALHTSLRLGGVDCGDEVVTQAISFVATANAITYCGASPIFLDSERQSLGLNPEALESFLEDNTETKKDGFTYNRKTGRRIAACVPVHIFGQLVYIEEICHICQKYNIFVVEDAAEALGSFCGDRHAGTFGSIGVLSFNGNKVITTGGGGMIVTDDSELATRAKHLTTTAKLPHIWEYYHDAIGYNYRLPNLNAAIGCAQLEQFSDILKKKRNLAGIYSNFLSEFNRVDFLNERAGTQANYWLNALILNNREERELFLSESNEAGVRTRPLWILLSKLPMFQSCMHDALKNAAWLEERVVNIPSSVNYEA